jgi:hypothetical protein
MLGQTSPDPRRARGKALQQLFVGVDPPALPRAEAATLECRLSFSPGVLPGEPEVIRQGLSGTALGTGGTSPSSVPPVPPLGTTRNAAISSVVTPVTPVPPDTRM